MPASSQFEYKAAGKELYRLTTDMWLLWDPEFLALSDQLAANNTLFLETFNGAWTTLMNADRFDGPTGNVCDDAAAVPAPPSSPASVGGTVAETVGTTAAAGVLLILLGVAAYYRCSCCARGKVEDNYLLASDSMANPIAAAR